MLDIQGRKYAAVTVCDVTLYDIVTNYPVMFFDTLQVTSIEGAAEVTDIQGGQGNATLASVSHSKTVDVTFDDAIMTMSSLALLTGGNLEKANKDHKITMTQTELVEVKGGESVLKLTEMPKKDTYVWAAKMINGVLSTATRTKALVTGATKEIALADLYNAEASDGADSVYRVFYQYEKGIEAGELSELTVLADKFAGTYRFMGDTVLFNQYSGSNDVFQIEIPKLKLDSSYSMSFNASTEAIVFSFKGKALRDDLGRMIIYRQIRQDNAQAGANSDAENVVWDGSFLTLPAEKVAIAENGTITPLNPVEKYPVETEVEGE